MFKLIKNSLIILVLIILFGCVQESKVMCEQPSIPMTDINGNTVCVMPAEQNLDDNLDSEDESIIDFIDAETNDQEQMIDDLSELDETSEEEESENIVGNDRDEHGCIPSAGYTWCEPKQKCLRVWEESCEEDKEKTEDNLESVGDTANLPRKEVKAGDLVSFPNLEAVDPDGDKIDYTFTSPLNEKGEWQTTENDAGEYIVTITASDGQNKVSQKVVIVVLGVNRPPVIKPISQITAVAGDKVKITPDVSDPNNDDLTLSFSEPFDIKGEWQTTEDDTGEYQIEVIVSDGEYNSSTNVVIIIKSINNPPVINMIDEITVYEGDTIKLEPEVIDSDGDELTISFSGWMNSDSYTTTYDDAGEYTVIITASDGTATVTKTVNIIVIEKNRPPVFMPGAFN